MIRAFQTGLIALATSTGLVGCTSAPQKSDVARMSHAEAKTAPWVSVSTITGTVIAVADGDTITVLDADHLQHKIRLAGIDAPEKGQAFGQRAKQHLSALVHRREVVAECGKVDRWERKVCKILVAGTDANLEQIRAGFAWHYKQYAKEQSGADRSAYAAAEDTARASRLGLWSDPRPVEPWVWRHQPTARSTADPD